MSYHARAGLLVVATAALGSLRKLSQGSKHDLRASRSLLESQHSPL